MTSTDLDAEIVKAVMEFADEAEHISTLGGFGQKLVALARAKRKAMAPQPLSVEEAVSIFQVNARFQYQALQSVLDACRERDLKVIEALTPIEAGSLHRVECRSLDDIRRALTGGK